MKLIRINEQDADKLAPLVAQFRVSLLSNLKIAAEPNEKAAREEIAEFLQAEYPIFAAEDGEEYAGYVVCKVVEECTWIEQIYVRGDYRRRGVATMLFEKAEEVAHSLGEETVFNYVHPNNQGMLDFLRDKGYTVLNMIEIRKPYKGEKLTTTINVGDNTFDYQ
ncbi:MAG: GNAT family N-acetyltransferase [Lachnospiraceae bacterium]|nr:GNAT family N-acetyltransferase [Lachnospiraceae bacterium]